MTIRRFVISGCSGGGKSSLIAALAKRGHATLAEAGRDLVREEIARDGTALPWSDRSAFAHRLLDRAIAQYTEIPAGDPPIFHDRSLIDPIAFLLHIEEALPEKAVRAMHAFRYEQPVFMAPPWAEIYEMDAERPKNFMEAVAEYEPLVTCFQNAGYNIIILPKTDVESRISFILDRIGN